MINHAYIYKIGKKGQKLTSIMRFRDSNGNNIYIFDTEKKL